MKVLTKTKANRQSQDKMYLTNYFSDAIAVQKLSEDKINNQIRKQSGIFLTNQLDIVDNILEIISSNEPLLKKKVLEPACGEGIFILRLLSKVYTLTSDKSTFDNYLKNNLFFVDINPQMLIKTKQNIKKLYKFLFKEKYSGILNGYVYDFTKKINSYMTHPLQDIKGQIDYVIGNPPYVSLYGRRDKKRNEEQRVYYLKNYAQFPNYIKNGKINYIMLFLEHSLEFMKSDGLLSFIIDISFFETAYKYTRKFLLENTNILSLDINISNFKVASGQLIIKLRKRKPTDNHYVKVKDLKTGKASCIQQVDWYNEKDEYKFRITQCERTLRLLKSIDSKNDKTILDIFPRKNLRTCVMALNMENKFVSEEEFGTSYPFYQGSKALREKFGQLSYNKYFNYNKGLQDTINLEIKKELTKRGIKNKKRIGLGERIIYENPKIFIRQSAKEIIASIDFNRSAANNSLYVFTLRSNSNEAIFILKFMCGWLNSELVTFYAQRKGLIRYSRGKQPQIKISDLGKIKIPADWALQNKIQSLVEKIYCEREHKQKYYNEINKIVYKYYSLNESEICFIKRTVKSF